MMVVVEVEVSRALERYQLGLQLVKNANERGIFNSVALINIEDQER